MIYIKKRDEVFMTISSDDYSTLVEIAENFTFEVQGFQHMPAYKNGTWDGKIRLFNIKTKKMYLGLLEKLKKFLDDGDHEYETHGLDVENDVTVEMVREFVNSLNIKMDGNDIEERDYQIKAIYESLKREKLLFTVPTSGGKTSITYAILRWYLQFDCKCLIIVPTKDLVNQSYDDFLNYSSHNGFDVKTLMHKIVGGSEKDTDHPITVSTWQSIYKLEAEWFNQFDVIIFDEAHKAASKELTGVMEKTTKVKFKIGMTGTIQDAKTHKLVLEGLFGAIVPIVTTKELMDKGYISNLKIQAILLNYDEDTKKDASRYMRTTQSGSVGTKVDYQKEINYLVLNENRNKFIVNLASHCKNTTLILFTFVERHGMQLYDALKAKMPDALVYILDGDSTEEERAEVKEVAKNQRVYILASYALYSTGVSIPAIESIIFAHPTKSKIRVLQSIGRGLRLYKDNMATLYDLGDDLTHKSYNNHTLGHFKERLQLYNTENFEYKFTKLMI